jgi:plasmid stabilization system protein ParE
MPPHFRINVQPRASNDIDEICSFIEQTSPQNAVLVARRIRDVVDSLQHLPHRCKVYRSSRNANLTVRATSAWPFIIYYRVSDSRRTVDVVAVIHGARIQPKRFT